MVGEHGVVVLLVGSLEVEALLHSRHEEGAAALDVELDVEEEVGLEAAGPLQEGGGEKRSSEMRTLIDANNSHVSESV